MKTTPRMQIILNEIGGKFGINLSHPGAYLRLELPGFDRLCIERLTGHQLSIAHYWEQSGYLVPEPDVVIFIQEALGWIPIEITQSMTGWRQVAEMSDDGTEILRYHPAGQADLASFVEQWAQNLREQGWLDQAICRATQKEPPAPKTLWPEPETDAPDMATLAEWLFDDWDCEATDGCIVEPDGRCPHGHPSWLLRLGLI